MTITSTTKKAGPYEGDGANKSFDFTNIKIWANSELLVVHTDSSGVETTLVLDTDYSVTITETEYPSDGSITYPISGSALPAGEYITIKRVLTLTQQTNLRNQGAFFAESVEKMVDRAIASILQQEEVIERSLRFVISADLTSFDLEIPAPVASNLVRINTAGTGFELITAASLGAVVMSNDNPIVAGTAAPGTSADASRADHVHPSSKDVVEALTNKTLDDPTNNIHADVVHALVRNVSGATITAGTPVYASGWNSGQERVEVSPADANDPAKMPAIGIMEYDLANNTNGEVIAKGVLVGNGDPVDTSAWSVGDELFVSNVVGTLTNVRPTAKDDAVQKVGLVVRSHASAGSILVDGAGRTNDLPNSATTEKGMLGKSANLGNLNSATTLHISDGNIQHATMTGSFTLTAPDDTDSGYLELELTIDATGGYTLTLSGFNEISGTADMTANVVNLLRVSKLNTNTYLEITQAV